MNVLKYHVFSDPRKLALFVNNNNIQKENILAITNANTTTDTQDYTIFFYGDAAVKEEVPGLFD